MGKKTTPQKSWEEQNTSISDFNITNNNINTPLSSTEVTPGNAHLDNCVSVNESKDINNSEKPAEKTIKKRRRTTSEIVLNVTPHISPIKHEIELNDVNSGVMKKMKKHKIKFNNGDKVIESELNHNWQVDASLPTKKRKKKKKRKAELESNQTANFENNEISNAIAQKIEKQYEAQFEELSVEHKIKRKKKKHKYHQKVSLSEDTNISVNQKCIDRDSSSELDTKKFVERINPNNYFNNETKLKKKKKKNLSDVLNIQQSLSDDLLDQEKDLEKPKKHKKKRNKDLDNIEIESSHNNKAEESKEGIKLNKKIHKDDSLFIAENRDFGETNGPIENDKKVKKKKKSHKINGNIKNLQDSSEIIVDKKEHKKRNKKHSEVEESVEIKKKNKSKITIKEETESEMHGDISSLQFEDSSQIYEADNKKHKKRKKRHNEDLNEHEEFGELKKKKKLKICNKDETESQINGNVSNPQFEDSLEIIDVDHKKRKKRHSEDLSEHEESGELKKKKKSKNHIQEETETEINEDILNLQLKNSSEIIDFDNKKHKKRKKRHSEDQSEHEEFGELKKKKKSKNRIKEETETEIKGDISNFQFENSSEIIDVDNRKYKKQKKRHSENLGKNVEFGEHKKKNKSKIRIKEEYESDYNSDNKHSKSAQLITQQLMDELLSHLNERMESKKRKKKRNKDLTNISDEFSPSNVTQEISQVRKSKKKNKIKENYDDTLNVHQLNNSSVVNQTESIKENNDVEGKNEVKKNMNAYETFEENNDDLFDLLNQLDHSSEVFVDQNVLKKERKKRHKDNIIKKSNHKKRPQIKIKLENKSSDEGLDSEEEPTDIYEVTDEERSKIAKLDFVMPYDIPHLHLLQKGSTTPKKELMNKIEQAGVFIKTGIYTKKEDSIIMENWKNFCKLHEIEENPAPFLSFKSRFLKRKQVATFLQFLGHNLDNRLLASVYQRFRRMFVSNIKKKGRFSSEEDEKILQYMKTTTSIHPFVDLAKILKNRTKNAVENRYINLIRSDRSRISWTIKKMETFLKILMKVTKCTVNELKNRTISREEWDLVSAEMDNLAVPKLRQAWALVVYPRLFTNNLDINRVIDKVLKILYKRNEDDWRNIDWKELASKFEGLTPEKLYSVIKYSINHCVPSRMRNNLKDALSFMKNYYLPSTKTLPIIKNFQNLELVNGNLREVKFSSTKCKEEPENAL